MSTRTYESVCLVLISCCCYRRAPTGRYSCIAQGASPGLCIETHLLSPFRGGTSAQVLGGCCVVLYLSVEAFACLCKCRSYGALYFVVRYLPRVSYRASPSFHPGLCRSAALAGLFYDNTKIYAVCRTHFSLGFVSWKERSCVRFNRTQLLGVFVKYK